MPSLLFFAPAAPTLATLTTSFSFVPTVLALGGLETFFTTRSGDAGLVFATATGASASSATRMDETRRAARVRFMAGHPTGRRCRLDGCYSAQLRAAPGRFEALDQLVAQSLDRDADLLQGVAVAEGDGVVVHRLVVDGDAPGGADLVLAAVALADRAALVELGGEAAAQVLEELTGLLRHPLLGDQREDGDLDRGQARVQAQDGALPALHLLDLVGVDEEGEGGAVGTGGRLDHVRDVALFGLLVEVLELLAAELGVLGEVEVAAVGDPLQLRPADREEVLDVAGRRGVVGELVLA